NEHKAQANAEAERKARQELEVSAYFRLIALANQRLANYDLAEVHRLLEECPPRLRHWEWYYLRRWYDGTPFVDLPFNTTPTQAWSVAFSPDGRQLAVALKAGAAQVWALPTRRVVRNLYHHAIPVSVAFSPDGSLLASGDGNGLIRLWDLASGRRVRTLRGHMACIQEVQFSPADGPLLASAREDHTLKLLGVDAGRELPTFARHTHGVFRPALPPARPRP